MKKLIIIICVLFIAFNVRAQNTDQTLKPERYMITRIFMDGEGYEPRNEYISVKCSDSVYRVYYGGYSTFSLKYEKTSSNDYYYYVSEEGIEEPLLRVSSDKKFSDLCSGDVSEGIIVISFECCLTEVLSYKRKKMSKK